VARSPAIAPTSGGGGGSDPTLTSTLGDIVDTTSPYSFAPTLTHTGTVLTTITRASDSSSVSVTGSTTTTPTATCTAADAVVGDSFHCESVATDSGITKTLVTTVFMEGTGTAGAAGTLTELLSLDFAAIFSASGAYDFLTDGPAGDGTHTHGGVTYELVGSATVTQLEITTNGLEMQQATGGAFELGVNLRDLATKNDPAGPVHVVARVSSAVSGASGDGVQVGIQRHATLGSWTLGDAVVRYRQADATPDLYAIAYNGSTHDVLASGTVTASGDVRMQVGLTSLYGSVCRGDTGTATDPAGWDTLAEFASADYAAALASFSGTYPATSDCWVFVGAGGDADGIFETLTAYGLEA